MPKPFSASEKYNSQKEATLGPLTKCCFLFHSMTLYPNLIKMHQFHPQTTHRPTAPLALPPSIDTHQALGSPSGRAGAKRLRGLTAPIPPTNYPQTHRTDPSYKTASLHALSAHPSPPPFGRYLSGRERQELGGNFKQYYKPEFIAPFKGLAQAKAPLCKGSCQRS